MWAFRSLSIRGPNSTFSNDTLMGRVEVVMDANLRSECHLWTPLRTQAVFWRWARCRMLPSVRPPDAAIGCGPVWEYADWIHISFPRLGSALPFPGSPSPVSPTVVPYPPSTDLASPTTSDADPGLRRDRHRSSINSALRQKGPNNARYLVGERHRHQHVRLALQHSFQPGSLGSSAP
jgi:hypothetical protein